MTASLPKWVTTDRFTVQANAPRNPTKDQFRLMVQTLLFERFGFEAPFRDATGKDICSSAGEDREDRTKMIPHELGPPCDSSPDPISKDGLQLPDRCDVFFLLIRGGRARSHRITQYHAPPYSPHLCPDPVGLGRPVVDETGLEGHFDFTMEYDATVGPNGLPA